MKHIIQSVKDLGLVIRAVRKSSGVRQDDLAGTVGVSRQFAVDVERGKPTVQFDRVLLLLKELGIELSVNVTTEASAKLQELQSKEQSAIAVGDTVRQRTSPELDTRTDAVVKRVHGDGALDVKVGDTVRQYTSSAKVTWTDAVVKCVHGNGALDVEVEGQRLGWSSNYCEVVRRC